MYLVIALIILTLALNLSLRKVANRTLKEKINES